MITEQGASCDLHGAYRNATTAATCSNVLSKESPPWLSGALNNNNLNKTHNHRSRTSQAPKQDSYDAYPQRFGHAKQPQTRMPRYVSSFIRGHTIIPAYGFLKCFQASKHETIEVTHLAPRHSRTDQRSTRTSGHTAPLHSNGREAPHYLTPKNRSRPWLTGRSDLLITDRPLVARSDQAVHTGQKGTPVVDIFIVRVVSRGAGGGS